MNTPIIGRIYHVVDKTTGEVVKVGSTTKSLSNRFSYPDYAKKYTNHCLKEVKQIHSSEFDLYEKGNPFCPFFWHLVAAEHVEMIRAKTFKTGPLSNQVSPLEQKFIGFDWLLGSSLGGKTQGPIQGLRNVLNGNLDKARKSLNWLKSRQQMRESGYFKRLSNLPQTVLARRKYNKNNISRLKEVRLLPQTKLAQSKTARAVSHNRWHVERGLVPSGTDILNCPLCINMLSEKEQRARYRHRVRHERKGFVSSVCKFCQAA